MPSVTMGWLQEEVGAGQGGGKANDRKEMLGTAFNMGTPSEGRPHLVTSREGEGKLFMSGLCLRLPGDMGTVIQPWMAGLSLVKWVPVTFSGTGQRSKY